VFCCCCLPGPACRCYKALYATLRQKVADVKVSCSDYQCFMSRVNIGVKHLQLGETHPSLSYIDEWMQEQVAVSDIGTGPVGCSLCVHFVSKLLCFNGCNVANSRRQ
jgi:hypothetical protein